MAIMSWIKSLYVIIYTAVATCSQPYGVKHTVYRLSTSRQNSLPQNLLLLLSKLAVMLYTYYICYGISKLCFSHFHFTQSRISGAVTYQLSVMFVQHCHFLYSTVTPCTALSLLVQHCHSLYSTVTPCTALSLLVQHCHSLYSTVTPASGLAFASWLLQH